MGVAQRANRSSSNMLNVFFSSLLISSTLALVQPLPREQPETKDLLCDICIDVITDLDQWLNSDSTEDQIVEWIEQVCDLLSAIVPEAICKSLIESQIPAIIDGLANDNLNPQELCSSIGACSDAPTDAPTTPAAPTTTVGTTMPDTTTTMPTTTAADPPTESPRLRKLL